MSRFLMANRKYMGLAENKHAAALDGTTNGVFIVGCCMCAFGEIG